jgi:cobalt-zinc-cadmium efflux system protein
MSRVQRLLLVLALNLALVVGLVAVGVTAHSLAVLAAGGDYLLDAAGVGVALTAIWLSKRPASGGRPKPGTNPSDIAALINGGWLLILEVLAASAAVNRLISGTPRVHGLPVLVMSGIAAFVMAGGALVLRGDGADDTEDGEHDLSLAAVLLDTIADAAAAAGVAVTGAIILATDGWYWLDPAVALIIAVVIAYHALTQPIMLGEVREVLHIKRRERQLIGEAAGRDPRVVDRPGAAALSRCSRQFTPHRRDALAPSDHRLVRQPVL